MDHIDLLLRETLDDVPVPPGGLERILRRVEARRRHRARLRAAGAATLALAVAVAVAAPFTGGTQLAAAKTVQVPGRIVDAVGTPGRLWVLTCIRRCDKDRGSVGRLLAIDAKTGRPSASRVVRNPQAVAAGDGSVWATDFWSGTVTRVDAGSGRLLATIQLKLPRPVWGDDDRFLPGDIAVGAGGVWVSTARGYVARIDPTTSGVTGYVRTADDTTGPVVAAGGVVWLGEGLALEHINDATGDRVRTTIDGPGGRRLSIGALTLVDGALWAGGEWAIPSRDAAGNDDFTATGESVLAELDPDTGGVRSLTRLPPQTTLRHGDANGLWLADGRGEISRFDPRTRRIVAGARVQAAGAVVPASRDRVWVARTAHELARVDLVPRHAPAR